VVGHGLESALDEGGCVEGRHRASRALETARERMRERTKGTELELPWKRREKKSVRGLKVHGTLVSIGFYINCHRNRVVVVAQGFKMPWTRRDRAGAQGHRAL